MRSVTEQCCQIGRTGSGCRPPIVRPPTTSEHHLFTQIKYQEGSLPAVQIEFYFVGPGDWKAIGSHIP